MHQSVYRAGCGSGLMAGVPNILLEDLFPPESEENVPFRIINDVEADYTHCLGCHAPFEGGNDGYTHCWTCMSSSQSVSQFTQPGYDLLITGNGTYGIQACLTTQSQSATSKTFPSTSSTPTWTCLHASPTAACRSRWDYTNTRKRAPHAHTPALSAAGAKSMNTPPRPAPGPYFCEGMYRRTSTSVRLSASFH